MSNCLYYVCVFDDDGRRGAPAPPQAVALLHCRAPVARRISQSIVTERDGVCMRCVAVVAAVVVGVLAHQVVVAQAVLSIPPVMLLRLV